MEEWRKAGGEGRKAEVKFEELRIIIFMPVNFTN
jgi:hypothetical protein